jgi:F-type H+-transporting ATPase subunit b
MKGGRGSIVALVLCLALILLMPAVVRAEGGPGGEENANPLRFNPDLGLFTLIIFVVLLFVLRKWAWGPMLEGLQKRENKIQGAIADAQRARDEAQRLQGQWHQEMATAQDKVREIHEEARRRAEQNTTEMIAKARTDIQAERDRLRREIEVARDQALQELWNQTARLATEVSARVLRREINPDDQRRLVEDALTEMNRVPMGGNGR